MRKLLPTLHRPARFKATFFDGFGTLTARSG